MSHVPNILSRTYQSTDSLDNQIREANAMIFQQVEAGQVNPQQLAMTIEANQRFIEYLEEVKQDVAFRAHDTSVTVRIDDEATVKFGNDQSFADWLSGRMDR